MQVLRTLVLLTVTSALVVAAPVPKERKADPVEAYQGEWTLIKVEWDGASLDFLDQTWTIAGEKAYGKYPNDPKRNYESKIKYDVVSEPNRLLMINDDEDIKESKWIVKVEGDLMYECRTKGKAEYPTEFSSKNRCLLVTYKKKAK